MRCLAFAALLALLSSSSSLLSQSVRRCTSVDISYRKHVEKISTGASSCLPSRQAKPARRSPWESSDSPVHAPVAPPRTSGTFPRFLFHSNACRASSLDLTPRPLVHCTIALVLA
uniref:Putative secreted protein n=1 Tax=Ixodes ricinus TaxID=34613 RepID=A0A147BCW9_IXORI